MAKVRQKDGVENLEFKWGIKRGKGGAKKDVQFYGSFTYDGEEYFLYDSVYLFQDNVPEPHIGRLIKIWEHQKTKKVKVLWYFRPLEISKYLGDHKVLENELFLATSDGNRNGDGSTNVNPLEAIAGKCNVVCISKDERNRQASLEELNRADFIFYRTFNVDTYTISAKLGDKIATVDVKCLLNKIDSQKSVLPRTGPCPEGRSEDFIASAERGPLLQNKDTCITLEPGAKLGSDTLEGQVALKSSSGGLGSVHAERSEVEGMENSVTNLRKPEHEEHPPLELDHSSKNSRDKTERVIKEKDSGVSVNGLKHSISPLAEVGRVKKADFSKNSRRASGAAGEADCSDDIRPFDGQASKKLKSADHRIGNTMKLAAGGTDAKLNECSTLAAALNDKIKHEGGKEPSKRAMSPVKSAETSGDLADHPSKKLKLNKHASSGTHKSHSDSAGGKFKAPLSAAAAGGSGGIKLKPSITDGSNTCLSNRLINGEMLKKVPDDKFPKVPSKQIIKREAKVYGQVVKVTRKPDADNAIWFTGMPWEEKMKAARVDGTLVMLRNLDPACTSAEVEDIVWHGFHESCTAKMLQRTATSSPHYGQALVIFKTEHAAKRVVQELEHDCLMLPNGRPLLAHVERPQPRGKPTPFPGHLVIEKLRFQHQKEKREAVSTSHASQANTLEYDMAVEWRTLQERSDFLWKNMFEQHLEELLPLRRNLKWKSRISAPGQTT